MTKKSLESYSQTNTKIESLTNMHKDILLKCEEEDINLPEITSQFDNIQTQMANEVKKANTTIKYLSEQVVTLEKNSNLDGLTKVYNRRALSTYLQEICSK